ncbi:MAG: hypothetical protein ACI304_00095 [Lepagella sp.]
MEIVVMIIMLLICMNVMIKLSFLRLPGVVILAALSGAWILLGNDYATGMSRSVISDWLGDPKLMLDCSVLVTIDVCFQLLYCFLKVKDSERGLRRREKYLLLFTQWIPGILLLPVLFAWQVEVIFSLPGMDFSMIGILCGCAVFLLFTLLAIGVRYLIPEGELRLEMMFLTNILIAILGIVATFNGKSIVTGDGDPDLRALLGVISLIIASALVGYLLRWIKRRYLGRSLTTNIGK